MRKIAIIGSCVSRDVFRVCEAADFEVVFYSMHTCIPAIVAHPTRVPDATNLDHLSPFYRRNLLRDFSKSLFQDLASFDYDAILVDLVEERYDLHVSNGEVISDSHALEITTLRQYCVQNMEFRKRTLFPLGAFDSQFSEFTSLLVKEAAGRPVFLNVCHFAAKYVNKGSLLNFEPSYVEAHNRMLDRYYEVVCSDPAVIKIDSRDKGFRGAIDHTWGVLPFHLEDAFYQYVIDCMRGYFGSVGVINVLSHEEYRFSPDFETFQADWLKARDFFIASDYHGCMAHVDAIRSTRRISADECHYYGRSLMKMPGGLIEGTIYLETASRHRSSEPIWVHLSLAQALRELGQAHRALKELLAAALLSEQQNTYANMIIFEEMTRLVHNPELTPDDQFLLSKSMFNFWSRSR